MRQGPAGRLPVQPVGQRVRHARLHKETRSCPHQQDDAGPTGGIATPAGLISLAIRLTGPARQAAGGDALWVGAGHDGLRAWFDTGYELTARLRAWASRHGLDQLDDHGGGKVRLDLRRSANR